MRWTLLTLTLCFAACSMGEFSDGGHPRGDSGPPIFGDAAPDDPVAIGPLGTRVEPVRGADAGTPGEDASSGSDAGPELDAGFEDAGPDDAGSGEDAAPPVDAGPDDAGPGDAGELEDANAGAADSGPPEDAGSEPDTGPDDAGPGPCLADGFEVNDSESDAVSLGFVTSSSWNVTVDPTFHDDGVPDADWYRVDTDRDTGSPTRIIAEASPIDHGWVRVTYYCAGASSSDASCWSGQCEKVALDRVDMTVDCADDDARAHAVVEATPATMTVCGYRFDLQIREG